MKGKPFYDFATKNKYFLDLHNYLKSKGIKNNKFMLKIYDKDLININPFDPEISNYNKQKVLAEIENNFFYFAREIVKIEIQGGGIGIPPYNKANFKFLNAFFLKPGSTMYLLRRSSSLSSRICI